MPGQDGRDALPYPGFEVFLSAGHQYRSFAHYAVHILHMAKRNIIFCGNGFFCRYGYYFRLIPRYSIIYYPFTYVIVALYQHLNNRSVSLQEPTFVVKQGVNPITGIYPL